MNSTQTTEPAITDLDELLSLSNRLLENIGLVVLGKPEVIRLAVVALLAEGHVLIEDVPGVGKTLLARAIAASIDCSFRRIQFTPDLLPSDVLGSSIYHAPSGEFVFKPGPLFANVILADEINRTTPRTQSALLEAMSDRQVSIEGQDLSASTSVHRTGHSKPLRVRGNVRPSRKPARPVHAPAADGIPDPIRRSARSSRAIATASRSRSFARSSRAKEVLHLQHGVRRVQVDDAITEYLLDIVHATRRSEDLHVGVSTRGALTLYRAAQSLALVSGRDYVVPDDIKTLVVPVLAHRVVGKSFLQAGEFGAAEAIIRDIVERLRVPV